MIHPFKKLTARFRYDDHDRPFLEHLEEFRLCLIRCVITLTVCMLICLPLAGRLIQLLTTPLRRAAAEKGFEVQIITTQPVEAFFQLLKAAAASGVIIALPFLIFFIGLFVLPGIRDHEKKIMSRITFAGGVLFLAGVLAGYWMTLPVAAGLFLRFNDMLGTAAMWTIDKYIGFVLQLLLGFGLAFELPLVLLLLGYMGLISARQMRQYRRHVVVGIFVVSMLLTPPDPTTQIMMAIPLYLLYECCIWILHLTGAREIANPDNETGLDSVPTTEEEQK